MISSKSADQQLKEWVTPIDLNLNKDETILCTYESPALGAVVALILYNETRDFSLVKFVFSQDSVTRSELAKLDLYGEERYKHSYEEEAHILGNRVFTLRTILDSRFYVGKNMHSRNQHIKVFDFNGAIVYQKSSTQSAVTFEHFDNMFPASENSFIGVHYKKGCGPSYKIYTIEPESSKDLLTSTTNPTNAIRLSNGKVYHCGQIEGKDVEGDFLCETNRGYLVRKSYDTPMEQHQLLLLNKSTLKPIKEEVLPNNVATPLYAWQQFNGNIVIKDFGLNVHLLNKNLKPISKHRFGNPHHTKFGQAELPIQTVHTDSLRTMIYGNPVLFFSDRRNLVENERNRLLATYFTNLIKMIPLPVLNIVLDYNLFGYCFGIDEAVKATTMEVIQEVEITDNALGKLQITRTM